MSASMQLPEMAIITGGGNGIGKALAFYCASKQIHLMLLDVNKQALNNTQKEISASYQKIKIITFNADVTNNNKLRERILPVLSSLNYNIKYLFNCAGILDLFASLTDPSKYNLLHKTMNINFWGYVNMIQCFLPYLDKHNISSSSWIINVSSVAGLASGWDIYCVSKSAVCSYSEALYRELRKSKKNIKVLIVCPGHINTNILKNTQNILSDDTKAMDLEFNEKKIRGEISRGMSPKKLCQIIFDAMKKNKFYVTSNEMSAYVSAKGKFNSIITGDFEESTRKKMAKIVQERLKQLRSKM